MPTNPTKRKIARAKTPEEKTLIVAQYNARQEIVALMAGAAGEIRRILLGAAGLDGTISPKRLEQVTGDAGDVIRKLFTDRNDPRGRRVFGEDNRALSPYAEVLNRWIAWSTRQAVKAAHNIMRRKAPEQVFGWLSTTPSKTVVVSEITSPLAPPLTKGGELIISEQTRSEELQEIAERLRIFSPNPLAQYEQAHTWVDPNGYRLSDRIWRTGETTRQRIDALIAEGIRESKSAVSIANLVEQFLRPDRAAIRTKKPYGQDGSYDAMRLARTEITRANGQAILVAGRMNPYVYAFVWNLSPSHPEFDVCDSHAQFSPYGVNDPFPAYPAHPHCLCYITSRVDDPVSVTQDLMRMMDEARADLLPYLTPAQVDAFTQQILGRHLAALGAQAEGIASARAGNVQFLSDLREPIRTVNGIFSPDVGRPGETAASLSKFLKNSDGPLSRAFFEGGFTEIGPDGEYLVIKDGVQAAARDLVAQTMEVYYSREYLIGLARSYAADHGVRNITDAEAATLLNGDYGYRAQAVLRAARIYNVSLTEAQWRRLNQISLNEFLDLAAYQQRRRSEMGSGAGLFGAERIRRMNEREEFLRNVVRGE